MKDEIYLSKKQSKIMTLPIDKKQHGYLYEKQIRRYIATKKVVSWPKDIEERVGVLWGNSLDFPYLEGVEMDHLLLFTVITPWGNSASIYGMSTDQKVACYHFDWRSSPCSARKTKVYPGLNNMLDEMIKGCALNAVYSYDRVRGRLIKKYPDIADLFVLTPAIPPEIELKFSYML